MALLVCVTSCQRDQEISDQGALINTGRCAPIDYYYEDVVDALWKWSTNATLK